MNLKELYSDTLHIILINFIAAIITRDTLTEKWPVEYTLIEQSPMKNSFNWAVTHPSDLEVMQENEKEKWVRKMRIATKTGKH